MTTKAKDEINITLNYSERQQGIALKGNIVHVQQDQRDNGSRLDVIINDITDDSLQVFAQAVCQAEIKRQVKYAQEDNRKAVKEKLEGIALATKILFNEHCLPHCQGTLKGKDCEHCDFLKVVLETTDIYDVRLLKYMSEQGIFPKDCKPKEAGDIKR